MIISGKTSSGFSYHVDSRMVKDMRFIDLVAEITRGGDNAVSSMSDLVRYLFKDRKEELYKHCADEDGYVDIEAVAKEITDICSDLAEHPETKN